MRFVALAFGIFSSFYALAVVIALGIKTAEEWRASSNEVALWLVTLALSAAVGIALGLSLRR